MKKSSSIDISGCLSRSWQQCGRGQKFRARLLSLWPSLLNVLDPSLLHCSIAAYSYLQPLRSHFSYKPHPLCFAYCSHLSNAARDICPNGDHFRQIPLYLEHIFEILILVKGRYCAHTIAIKFREVACKNWDGRGWESSKLFYMALGNGRQNVTLQAPSIVWRYGKEYVLNLIMNNDNDRPPASSRRYWGDEKQWISLEWPN